MKVGLGCGRWGGKMNRRGSALESFRGSCDSLWQIKWIICYTVMTEQWNTLVILNYMHVWIHTLWSTYPFNRESVSVLFSLTDCHLSVYVYWWGVTCTWTLKALSMTHTDLSRWDRCLYNILSRARAWLLIYFM